MAKKSLASPLHKLVHPYAAIAVLVCAVALAVVAIFFVLKTNPSMQSSQQTTRVVPTATPTPIDTSNWKTYSDTAYNYSVKLPPDFAGYRPTKGFTGDNPDPEGTGIMQFEETTHPSDYPQKTPSYGFGLQLGFASAQAEQCATDQECYNLLTNFYKNIPGKMEIYPIQATIP